MIDRAGKPISGPQGRHVGFPIVEAIDREMGTPDGPCQLSRPEIGDRCVDQVENSRLEGVGFGGNRQRVIR